MGLNRKRVLSIFMSLVLLLTCFGATALTAPVVAAQVETETVTSWAGLETEPVVAAQDVTETVTTWADLKAEVEKTDGASTIIVDGSLVADSAISVTREVTITGAGGSTPDVTIAWDASRGGSFFSVGAVGILTLENITLDGTPKTGSYMTGAALVAVNAGTLNLNDGAVLMNNRLGAGQGGNGAGVYVIGNSETQKGIVNIDGGSIENNLANSAGGSGGGICVSNYGELNMISGIIADNESVSGGGGGVYVQSDGIFNMSGGSIEDNTAYNGGGIAVYGTLNATGGDITGNTATTPPTTTSPNTSFRGKGGGIYVGQGAKNVTLGGLTISNNTAHGYGTANSTDSFGVGGGVCFDDGITTASDFSAIITGNTVISNNKAIASNTISSPTTVVSATSEYSGLGGGIYRGKDVDLVLQDVSITGNTAYRGGGVYSNDTGTGTLTLEKDSTNPTSAGPSITNNTAEAAIDGYTTEITTDGGGIYTNADSSNPAAVKTTITAVQIKNNTAESNGGGAYFAGDVAMDGKVAIDNSNSAAGQANGAYLGTNIIIVTALDQDTDIHIGGVSGPAPGRIIATNAALDAASRFTLGTALSDYIAAYDNGNVILAPRPTYTVTLNVNGGNNLAKSTITVEKDGTYDDLPTPARTDHTFNGWYTAPQGGTKVSTGDKIAVNADHILYAQWSDDKVSVSPKTADSMDAALYLVITAALLSLAAAVLYRRRFNS